MTPRRAADNDHFQQGPELGPGMPAINARHNHETAAAISSYRCSVQYPTATAG